MQNAFSRNEEFTQGDLLDSIASCIPLAQISQTQIQSLTKWAEYSGAKSASLKVSEINFVLPPLEVDNYLE